MGITPFTCLSVATRLPPQTLEGHSARCLLLYLYLSALEPTLDGLGEWLWAATGRIASSSSSAAAAAYAGASELPVDFFIARGGAPGKPPVGASRHRRYKGCMQIPGNVHAAGGQPWAHALACVMLPQWARCWCTAACASTPTRFPGCRWRRTMWRSGGKVTRRACAPRPRPSRQPPPWFPRDLRQQGQGRG